MYRISTGLLSLCLSPLSRFWVAWEETKLELLPDRASTFSQCFLKKKYIFQKPGKIEITADALLAFCIGSLYWAIYYCTYTQIDGASVGQKAKQTCTCVTILCTTDLTTHHTCDRQLKGTALCCSLWSALWDSHFCRSNHGRHFETPVPLFKGCIHNHFRLKLKHIDVCFYFGSEARHLYAQQWLEKKRRPFSVHVG